MKTIILLLSLIIGQTLLAFSFSKPERICRNTVENCYGNKKQCEERLALVRKFRMHLVSASLQVAEEGGCTVQGLQDGKVRSFSTKGFLRYMNPDIAPYVKPLISSQYQGKCKGLKRELRNQGVLQLKVTYGFRIHTRTCWTKRFWHQADPWKDGHPKDKDHSFRSSRGAS